MRLRSSRESEDLDGKFPLPRLDEKPTVTEHLSHQKRDPHMKHHIKASLFDIKGRTVSYRGFMVLTLLLLMTLNARLVWENLFKYGILIDLSVVLSLVRDPLHWPCSSTLLSFLGNFFLSCYLENNASKLGLGTVLRRLFHVANILWVVVVPIVVIYRVKPNPAVGILFMMYSTTMYLKMASFAVERDAERRRVKRAMSGSAAASSSSYSSSSPSSSSSLDNDNAAVVRGKSKAVPVVRTAASARNRSRSASRTRNDSPSRGKVERVSESDGSLQQQGERDDHGHDRQVPTLSHVPFSHILYFVIAPTLVYEREYPLTPRIRRRRLFFLISQAIFLMGVIVAFVQQYVSPLAMNAIDPIEHGDVAIVVERVLKLAIPNMIVWLIGFYVIFHLQLNIIAEITRFGDREFYLDWWNSSNLEYFWRSWNIPVHKWMKHTVYLPLVRRRWSRTSVNFIAFFISAALHELIVSVPFRDIKMWAFLGMFAQVPLIILTRIMFPNTGSDRGNAIFWLSILLGQPLLVLAYFYQFSVHKTDDLGEPF